MKLSRKEKGKNGETIFVFQLVKQERECLLDTLELYPSLDMYLQPLSRTGAVNEESQKLLEEAATELRKERRKKLSEFFKGSPRLKRDITGHYRLFVNGEEIEWLLQVLNEIRVCCWIKLGRPDTDFMQTPPADPAQARIRGAMDLSGYFQAEILENLSSAG